MILDSQLIPQNLYSKMVRLMPVPCVDLVIYNELGEILLLKRTNEPFKNHWWYPGGRVHFLENRMDSAFRKFSEECGLEKKLILKIDELATKDLIMVDEKGGSVHSITTLFLMQVLGRPQPKLDNQSSDAKWKNHQGWIGTGVDQFILDSLSLASNVQKTLGGIL